MQLDYITEQIKQSVPILQAVEYYTGEKFCKNKIRCPLHNEKTASFTVYPKTNTFYCFGCGTSGDIIHFVQQYFNIDYVEAIKRLEGDFNLCLLSRPTFSEYRKRKKEIQRHKTAQQKNRKRYLRQMQSIGKHLTGCANMKKLSSGTDRVVLMQCHHPNLLPLYKT